MLNFIQWCWIFEINWWNYGKGTIYKDSKKNQINDGANLIDDEFIFQHDYDPKHNSDLIQDSINGKGINSLKWFPNNPDLRSIENCFYIFKKKPKKYWPNTILELEKNILIVWNEINPEYFQKLYD